MAGRHAHVGSDQPRDGLDKALGQQFLVVIFTNEMLDHLSQTAVLLVDDILAQLLDSALRGRLD